MKRKITSKLYEWKNMLNGRMPLLKEYIEFLKHMDLGFAVSEGTVRGKDSKAG